jgi:hypothetical protein
VLAAGAPRVDAEHLHVARVARPVPLEDLDRRRLAGAVRAEEPEDLAGAHLEVDPRNRLDTVVRLHEALDADRGLGAAHARRRLGPDGLRLDLESSRHIW